VCAYEREREIVFVFLCVCVCVCDSHCRLMCAQVVVIVAMVLMVVLLVVKNSSDINHNVVEESLSGGISHVRVVQIFCISQVSSGVYP
jgi:hypothetical protein